MILPSASSLADLAAISLKLILMSKPATNLARTLARSASSVSPSRSSVRPTLAFLRATSLPRRISAIAPPSISCIRSTLIATGSTPSIALITSLRGAIRLETKVVTPSLDTVYARLAKRPRTKSSGVSRLSFTV